MDRGSARHPAEVFHPHRRREHRHRPARGARSRRARRRPLLWWVIRKTRAGLEMRAVVDRSELAGLRGVNAGANLGPRLDPHHDPRRARWDTHHTAVPAERHAVHAGRARFARGRGARRPSLDTRSDSSVGSCSGSSRTCWPATATSSFPSSSRSSVASVHRSRSSSRCYSSSSLPHVNAAAGPGRLAEQAAPSDHRAGLPAWRRRLPWFDLHRGLPGVLPPVGRRRRTAGRCVRAGHRSHSGSAWH